MKIRLAVTAVLAAFLAPGTVSQSHAQEQVVEMVTCESRAGSRTSCAVDGEVISAGIQRQLGDGSPCFLGFTWGFEENGIWTGNGCSAEFALTVERATAKPVVDPLVLRDRLRGTRKKLRNLRTQLAKEKESRSLLETELAEAQEALRQAAEAAPKAVNKKRKNKPQEAIRSVAVCSNKAIRDARKAGTQKPNIIEIVSARPTQRTWLVIGRMSSEIDGQRRVSYFRCWTEKGKVIRFSDDV